MDIHNAQSLDTITTHADKHLYTDTDTDKTDIRFATGSLSLSSTVVVRKKKRDGPCALE